MAIMKAHPEVKSLMGQDIWTFWITVGVVLAQVGMAALLGHFGIGFWWAALIAGWCIGAFANHAMFVVIHDATHNLVFKNVVLNKLCVILADLPNTVPTGMGFRCYHVKHHSHLGDYDFDADLPSRWEADLVGNKWYMKAGWMFFFAIFQLTRLERLKGTVPMRNRWTVYNSLAIIAFDLAILWFCGLNGLLYLFASFWFSVGLHPLGARWIQEHFTLDPEQETFDYYGPLNVFALNIGYHNEHHDFPDIPWRRLPELKRMAPEFYLTLKSRTRRGSRCSSPSSPTGGTRCTPGSTAARRPSARRRRRRNGLAARVAMRPGVNFAPPPCIAASCVRVLLVPAR